ncbi:hypothetical protein [Streptomyces sp. NBC_00370]|uniref:hypothetical protein n=1 Tax=Streptomyces sp. NBC_00370 TaxID=2975728 RepID=UPI002E252825
MSSRQTRPDPEGPSRRPAEGAGGSSVRRAVALGPVVSAPGAELTPAGPPSAGTVRGASEEAVRPRSTTSATSRQSAEPESAEPESTPGPDAAPTTVLPVTAPVTAQATAPAPSSPTPTRTPTATAARVSARPDDEPPSGPSRKPLLAAAGVVGVALLAVPLVVWAAGESGQKKDNVSTAANTEDRSAGAPLVAAQPVHPAEKPKATPTKKHTTKKHTTKPSPASKPELEPVVKAEKPAAAPHWATKPSPPAPKKVTPYLAPGPQMPTDRSAATRVQQLVAHDPGRHICYRVYVKTFGWQSAVCDGTTAGSDVDSRSVKAIQIAVSGTSGTSATAYIQAKGWVKKPWMTVADGSNLTLGEARQDAPNLSGFGISVGKGNVCQNTYSSKGPWQGVACDTPQTANNYIFGGTMDVTRWLDAVRFTV